MNYVDESPYVDKPDPRHQTAVFAGKNALGWVKAMGERLAEMEAGGTSARDIWRRLGTYRGPDQELRWEIPDDKSRMLKGTETHPIPEHLRAAPAPMFPLEDVLDHPALYSNYPDMRNVGVKLTNDMGSNARGEYYEGDDWIKMKRGMPDDIAQQTLLHEIQHAIQGRENFSRGANQQYWPDRTPLRQEKLKDLMAYQDVQQLRDLISRYGPAGALEEFKSVMGRAPTPRWQTLLMGTDSKLLDKRINDVKKEYLGLSWTDKPFDLYRKAAGEVEARNVERRMDLEPYERLSTFPGDSQDVPFLDQVLLRGNVR